MTEKGRFGKTVRDGDGACGRMAWKQEEGWRGNKGKDGVETRGGMAWSVAEDGVAEDGVLVGERGSFSVPTAKKDEIMFFSGIFY